MADDNMSKEKNIPEAPIEEDHLSEDDEEMLEERTSYIPPFSYLLNPVKIITLGHPGSEITGFKFAVGSGLSNNFLMSHEFQMAPKAQGSQTGNPMMDMFAEKTPFYSLSLQYHHGDLARGHRPAFSLVSKADAGGKVDAILFKNFGNLRAKLHSSFMNSNIMYSSTQLELEHQGKTAKQVLTLATQAINYNILERLGKNWLAGLELNYLFPKKTVGTGVAVRYSPNSQQKHFMQYSSMMNTLIFGSFFRFTDDMSIGMEVEMGGQQKASSASIGLQRKTKNYKVNTSLKTDGDLKSIFTYQAMTYKLKLFLGGNLFKEDFRAGYGFSLGQTED